MLPGYLGARVDQLIARRDPASPLVCGWPSEIISSRSSAAHRTTRQSNGYALARAWPDVAARFSDAAGRPPVYTFFYPEEEYHAPLIEPLAEMTRDGIADVEVHIHHDGEGAQNLVDRINRFTTTLVSRHGLLRRENGRIRFGFIHGNWALANSLPNGRWCGVDNEITLLRDLGCYADFTMPSGESESQARLVNRLYWAIDAGDGRKAHDTGPLLQPGGPAGDLLMIPGPLGLRWRERRIERGEIAGYDMPTAYRIARWLAIAPRVGNDIFIKLFTHGARSKSGSAPGIRSVRPVQ